MDDAKKKANELKKWYIEEIEIHRKNGNYKYEITPSMVANAFLMGYETAKNKEIKQ